MSYTQTGSLTKMPRKPRDITDAELAVLQVLWTQGTATIRAIMEALYPQGSAAEYATVQKLLDRLEEKKCVQRLRGPGAHQFQARLQRDDLIQRRLREVADSLCGGSLTPLLSQLVDQFDYEAEELEELRKLVQRLNREEPN